MSTVLSELMTTRNLRIVGVQDGHSDRTRVHHDEDHGPIDRQAELG